MTEAIKFSAIVAATIIICTMIIASCIVQNPNRTYTNLEYELINTCLDKTNNPEQCSSFRIEKSNTTEQ